MALSLIYKEEYQINNYIKIVIPKVGQVIDNEGEYYDLVTILTAMPIDLMCQLDDAGIDFTTINEYQLFLMLFDELKSFDTSMIFKDLDLTKFHHAIDETNGERVLLDIENDLKIDRGIYERIADALRKIHHLEKNRSKPANEEAKLYMIERAQKKRKRRANKARDSSLESLIVAMVNTQQYKYDFEGTRELSIYQFNESVRQVIKKVDYENKMYGVYTGSVNVKELSQDELNWLIHK